jgi:hypothetical protein
MEKIDRLGWADGISFVSFGRRVGIRVNDPAVMDRLPEVLPPGWKPASSPVVDFVYSLRVSSNPASARIRNYNLLYGGSGRLVRTMDREEVFATLKQSLELLMAHWARGRVFVHAGVVGWRERAIVLPGEACGDKTDLVAALVQAGAIHYSDDYAVFDARGRVYPYVRPLAPRGEGNGHEPPSRSPSPGSRARLKALPVGLIALAEYQPGARWRPRPLTPGLAVLGLLAHTIPARHRPAAALATLEQVVTQARAVKGKRGDAEHTAQMLLATLPS